MRLKIVTLLATLFLVTACGYSPADEDGSWDAWSGVQDYLAEGVPSTVYFAFDSSALESRAKDVLDKQANWLKGNGKSVMIEGHCDERGTREYNLALGERRANAVKHYLASKGVSGGQLRTISYGAERPRLADSNENAWEQNRRGVTMTD